MAMFVKMTSAFAQQVVLKLMACADHSQKMSIMG